MGRKNIHQLLDDILPLKDITAYRLGTVVIHKDSIGKFNIVDGQQRIVTLTLLAYIIKNKLNKTNDINKLSLLKWSFENHISKYNIKINYKIIENRINELSEVELLEFYKIFFNKCEFVYVEIDDISEAFQFFDSQNARGKDLDPHDLLKAFHLREMYTDTEEERLLAIKHWEKAIEDKILKKIFDSFLFRIRNWSRGRQARFFTKDNIDIFKGISFNKTDEYPYVKSYRISDAFTKKYSNSIDRQVDLQKTDYPFQIDQVIINGKRFFEYIDYYSNLLS